VNISKTVHFRVEVTIGH